jgi:uncharacterized protein YycO
MILRYGDIIMVRTNHFMSKLIRFGQRDYGPEASRWNHCAVYIGNFEIVEALTSGVVRSPLNKYPTTDTRVLNPLKSSLRPNACDELLRANAVSFALSCIGEKYGFLTIFAIACKVLTKGKIDFNLQGTSICSGLSARACERYGFNFNPFDPAELTPAYLDTVLA